MVTKCLERVQIAWFVIVFSNVLADNTACFEYKRCALSPNDSLCSAAIGSFACLCKKGFFGNGSKCAGKRRTSLDRLNFNKISIYIKQ